MIKGYWKDESKEILKKFFKCECIDDSVEDDLPDERAYLTLVAIYVLQEKFEDREDEWYFIVKKGKDYLSNLGVNTNELLSDFSLELA